MHFKGMIFDFNGTLFEDSEKNNSAWRHISKKIRGYAFTDEELMVKLHGRTNNFTIEYLTDGSATPDELEKWSEEKEQIYRDMCMRDKANLKLAPGARELLDFLRDRHIPVNIATASIRKNVDFYIESFGLK